MGTVIINLPIKIDHVQSIYDTRLGWHQTQTHSDRMKPEKINVCNTQNKDQCIRSLRYISRLISMTARKVDERGILT